ncbi:hypothetical protein VNO77_31981 [Canavalia gladiata]|uniref:Uncharacterized protein n=1 Tax=Canavalia gladiata TaxID=3824 RepID=A0AAN9KSX5_CANGL
MQLCIGTCLIYAVINDEDGQAQNIPGISSARLADLRVIIHENDPRVLQLAMECISNVPKANYLLLSTVHELEAETIDSIKAIIPIPVYSVGPVIPYLELGENPLVNSDHSHDYMKWLNSQPAESVLYISFGSFLSVSSAQMDQIAEALNSSKIRYLWVARREASRLTDKCGDKGMVVPWCDQLKVLSHSSIGGFWSHCGWNSTLEAIFAGVPMLTFPLLMDQVPNSSQIVGEWNNGCRIEKSKLDSEVNVAKEYIEELVKSFMDLEREEGKKIRDRTQVYLRVEFLDDIQAFEQRHFLLEGLSATRKCALRVDNALGGTDVCYIVISLYLCNDGN